MQLPTQIRFRRARGGTGRRVRCVRGTVASASCPDRPVVQALPDSPSVFVTCSNHAQSTLQPQAHHYPHHLILNSVLVTYGVSTLYRELVREVLSLLL